ncbi:MAG: hypothetical protein HONBIEJF_01576 [Fimbriimonadaceae bacterium]|nr:hypothetical protein [Fimbriimonadaceae bacterium]
MYKLTNCVALGVGKLDDAVALYGNALGWEEIQRKDDWVEMRAGDLRIFLVEDDETTPTFDLAVPSIDEAMARLQPLGFRKIGEKAGEIFIEDPYGIRYALTPKV